MIAATRFSETLNLKGNDRLIDVIFKAPEVVPTFPIHLVLLVDRSGSMMDSFESIKKTLRVIHKFISDMDRKIELTLISFSDEAELNYPNSSGISYDESVDQLIPDGMTNLFQALTLTKKILASKDGYKSLILLSDGMPNLGEFVTGPELALILDREIFLSKTTIGYGNDYDPNLLNEIGDFNYAKTIHDVNEIIPCILGIIINTHGCNGRFIVKTSFQRIVIGQLYLDKIYNGQTYHLGLAYEANSEELSDLEGMIEFEYTDIQTGQLVKFSSDIALSSESKIPPSVMGMYHEASCYRLMESYRNNLNVRRNYLLINRRVNDWRESPTKNACVKRIQDLISAKHTKDDVHLTTEFGTNTIKQTSNRLVGNYTTHYQAEYANVFSEYF